LHVEEPVQVGGKNFRLGELAQVVGIGLHLPVHAGFDFRGLALEEAKKCHRPYLVSQAAALAEGVRPEHYAQWGRPGIRAQLVDLKRCTLVEDFVIECDARSLNVLNAVSPGSTCAISFSRFVCDMIEHKLGFRAAGAGSADGFQIPGQVSLAAQSRQREQRRRARTDHGRSRTCRAR
jgi:hypothetical protein